MSNKKSCGTCVYFVGVGDFPYQQYECVKVDLLDEEIKKTTSWDKEDQIIHLWADFHDYWEDEGHNCLWWTDKDSDTGEDCLE